MNSELRNEIDGEVENALVLDFPGEQQAVDVFLQRMLNVASRALWAEKQRHVTLPTSASTGQVQWRQHQVSTIEWLISINMQRKERKHAVRKPSRKRR